ncbi:hypothetical protein ACFQZX_06890 [Mucilaginibacter litoreus]|uniref:Tissue inhibitor of metalloproteinase n=1 Tax=Mucilaginibacter litoreus TaxID=1048221 RepID=A0ABW3AQL7_9SPHI
MKALIFIAAIVFTSLTASAQLANTSWKGIIAAPTDVEVILRFKKDTINIVIAGTDNVIESMKYTLKGDEIIINKLSGGSPCSTDQTAVIKYVLKDSKLILIPTTDPCDERKNAWPAEGFVKE